MGIKNFLRKNYLWLILFIGFSARALFYLFVAKIYYGTSDFYVGGDTSGWMICIQNLIHHGTYTMEFSEPTGYFFRPPGYSFFIGFFYLLSGENTDLCYRMIIWAQIFLDTISILLIYKIVERVSASKRWGALSALLYALYPFVIVWTPIVYAETFSVFIVLFSLWNLVRHSRKRHLFLCGVFLGIASLTRLQLIFVFPSVLLAVLFHYRNNFYAVLKYVSLITVGFVITYGWWPARNYFLHDRLIFSQDLSAVINWDKDYMGFMDYVFAVKTDYQPQYSQIVNGGEHVEWPPAAYIVKGDSEKLARVSKMCHDCGYGFSAFIKNEGLRKGNLPKDSSCSAEIAQLWSELKANQVQCNKANYYLWVPLGNLKKCFFKNGLYKPSTGMVYFASSVLFGYRTIMIFLGLSGLILFYWMKKKIPLLMKIILLYFILWYFWNSFVYRNMEIRFLIHADLLLLIPAAFLLLTIVEKIADRKKSVQ